MKPHEIKNLFQSLTFEHLTRVEVPLDELLEQTLDNIRARALSALINPAQTAENSQAVINVDSNFQQLIDAHFTPADIAKSLLQRIVSLEYDFPSHLVIDAWLTKCLKAGVPASGIVSEATQWLDKANNPIPGTVGNIKHFGRNGLHHVLDFIKDRTATPAPGADGQS